MNYFLLDAAQVNWVGFAGIAAGISVAGAFITQYVMGRINNRNTTEAYERAKKDSQHNKLGEIYSDLHLAFYNLEQSCHHNFYQRFDSGRFKVIAEYYSEKNKREPTATHHNLASKYNHSSDQTKRLADTYEERFYESKQTAIKLFGHATFICKDEKLTKLLSSLNGIFTPESLEEWFVGVNAKDLKDFDEENIVLAEIWHKAKARHVAPLQEIIKKVEEILLSHK